MENENIINLGTWTYPHSWDELTLKTYQEIDEYYSDKDKKFDLREVLHIFTNHTVDEVNALPIQFAEEIMHGLEWLAESPNYGKPSNSIEIDGETYMVNIKEKLKTGEYIAVDTVVKDNPHNYAAILAILCRKKGELYDSKFENEVLPDRIALWERQPMMEVMPIVHFFINLWAILGNHTQLYLMVQEALSLTQKRIETLHRNGEISKRSMKSAMKKLKKLKESINYT